jgi:hypothetical protein
MYGFFICSICEIIASLVCGNLGGDPLSFNDDLFSQFLAYLYEW